LWDLQRIIAEHMLKVSSVSKMIRWIFRWLLDNEPEWKKRSENVRRIRM
jgi:hypothetical protein